MTASSFTLLFHSVTFRLHSHHRCCVDTFCSEFHISFSLYGQWTNKHNWSGNSRRCKVSQEVCVIVIVYAFLLRFREGDDRQFSQVYDTDLGIPGGKLLCN